MKSAVLLWISLSLAALAACDATLDPFEKGDVAFGVYGYLDTSADTQRVRVEPVVPVAPFDTTRIAVTLVDETGGSRTALRPRVVPLGDRGEGLVYEAPLRALPGHVYRLGVSLDGVVRTTAQVEMPAQRQGRFEPVEQDSIGRLFLPVRLDGPLDAPTRIRVVYTVHTEGADSLAFSVQYAAGSAVATGYRYRLQVDRDRAALLSTLGRPPTDVPVLRAITIELRDDVADRAVQPVVGGVGLLSAVTYSTERFVLPDSVVRQIGFWPEGAP